MRQANIETARGDLAKAKGDLKRRRTLAKSGGVSGEEILHAQTAEKAAQSGLAQAQAALAVAKAKLETNQALTAGTTVAEHPDVKQAAGRLRNAWLANARTALPAPVDGMVAERSAPVGQRVAPGTPLMTVVPLAKVWVEPNFKDGQLARKQTGPPAPMTSDPSGRGVFNPGQGPG